ncbi:MAG: sigma-E processing peptidase SpoIIGA [Clostridium sp.]|nr:sigma-E processing peptidase SpoIIGA [Clostridium sp.]
MTYVLYADVMLVWSSIINAVVLALAAAILNMRIKITRVVIWAALTGAVTTAEYILMMGGNKFLHYILYVAIYIIMTTGFFTLKSFWGSIRLLLTILLAMIVIYGIWGAAANKIKSRAVYPVFLLFVFLLILLCRNVKKYREYETNICNVSILANHKCIRCRGYLDSGNMLFDYATDCPVIIISRRLSKRLLGENINKFLEAYKKNGVFDYVRAGEASDISIYPICYSTISEACAVMPGFKLNRLCLPDTNAVFTNVVAGISRNTIGGSDYEILLHACMIRQKNSM